MVKWASQVALVIKNPPANARDMASEGGSGWGTHVNPWLFHFNV